MRSLAIKRRLTFINGGKHFWNRERKIISKLKESYDIQLVVHISENANYKESDIIDFAKTEGIHLILSDLRVRRASDPRRIRADFRTFRQIKNFQPELLYVESFGSPYLALLLSRGLRKVKKIFAIMDYRLHSYVENSAGKLSERFYQWTYIKYFDNFHLFSSTQLEIMRKDYPAKKLFHIKLYLIENNFPNINVPPANQAIKKFEFLYFGKVYHYKGLDILIAAGEILAKRRKDFRITIAGKVNPGDLVLSGIKSSDQFEVINEFLPKEKIPSLFMRSHYFVLPYREVTQSGPLMISFHFNLPTITSDILGFKELITHSENGYCFESDSPESLANLMEGLMDGNKKTFNAVHSGLKEYVSTEYSPERFATKYDQMFKEVLE